jgi:hypothetical protein
VRTQDRLALRRRAARTAVLWTLALFLVAVVIVVSATVSLANAQQACLVDARPCPDGSDPRLAWIGIGFLGVPLVWLLGLLVLAARAMTAQRRG